MTVTDLPLFAPVPLVRARDHRTSRLAADRVTPVLTPLRLKVYQTIRDAGPYGLTAKELERLPQFADLAPSTARKRISELLASGHIVAIGVREGAKAWTITDPVTVEAA
jgi:hypothetical protein